MRRAAAPALRAAKRWLFACTCAHSRPAVARRRSKKQAGAAEDATPDAPAEESAPEEEDAPAEGAAVDPGVASAAASARAAAAFAAGDVAGACAAWTEALIWAPGDAALLCRRAEGQLALGRAAESLADARSAAQLRPRLAEPHVRAGLALMALEKLDEAAAAFRRSLELEPTREARPLLRLQCTRQLTCCRAVQDARIQLKAAEHANAGRACLAALEGHSATVSALIAAPCAAAGEQTRFMLATAASDGSLRLWDAAAGSGPGAVAAHKDGVVWAAWAPDASAIAIAGADGTVCLWRVADGDALAAPPQLLHELKVRSAARASHQAAAMPRTCAHSVCNTTGPRGAMYMRRVHAGRRAAGELRRGWHRARVARRRRNLRARHAGPHEVHRLSGASASSCAS